MKIEMEKVNMGNIIAISALSITLVASIFVCPNNEIPLATGGILGGYISGINSNHKQTRQVTAPKINKEIKGE